MLNAPLSLLVAALGLALPFQGHALALEVKGGTPGASSGSPGPTLVPLTRESVPVRRNNQTVSFKTSYSGWISLGHPKQDFRVVFDTGSGHVVVPSVDCMNETCQIHKRYDLSKSETAVAINVNGEPVPEDELCDQVTIGYGTGKVTGEFARERVCLGEGNSTCVEVNVVMAVEMTPQPFKSFNFDGIFGLALDGLAISPEFSFFNTLANSMGWAPQFAVFLADSEDGRNGEIALGGYNDKRLLQPLSWAPVAHSKLGYWQVQINAIRVGNVTLDTCRDGSCRGVVDTGTSHLGVPGSLHGNLMSSLTAHDVDHDDCRDAPGPTVELVLDGLTLTLEPENYMRQLSLAKGVTVGSQSGVTMDSNTATMDSNSASRDEAAHNGAVSTASTGSGRRCAPRLMPVNLPAPLGPNLFILGEPVLHRYYTVYDWKKKQIGFGLSANAQNIAKVPKVSKTQSEDDDDTFSFMQVTVTVTFRALPGRIQKRNRLPL